MNSVQFCLLMAAVLQSRLLPERFLLIGIYAWLFASLVCTAFPWIVLVWLKSHGV